ncbi:atherin-like [Cervus elaphus]|uniref:atherin-like n=1 Tax=Cervus elaphus TaxID=9860 RepID=UPI001CC2B9C2|nr:atherin-like [Cervus elaphus]
MVTDDACQDILGKRQGETRILVSFNAAHRYPNLRPTRPHPSLPGLPEACTSPPRPQHHASEAGRPQPPRVPAVAAPPAGPRAPAGGLGGAALSDVPSPPAGRGGGGVPAPHLRLRPPRGRAARTQPGPWGGAGAGETRALAPATGGKLQAPPDPELPPPRPSHPPLGCRCRCPPGRRRRHYRRRHSSARAPDVTAPRPLRESSAPPRADVSASPAPARPRPLAVPQPPGRATRPCAGLGPLLRGRWAGGWRVRVHTRTHSLRGALGVCLLPLAVGGGAAPTVGNHHRLGGPVPRNQGPGLSGQVGFPPRGPRTIRTARETLPAACPRFTSAAFPVLASGRRPRVGRPRLWCRSAGRFRSLRRAPLL